MTYDIIKLPIVDENGEQLYIGETGHWYVLRDGVCFNVFPKKFLKIPTPEFKRELGAKSKSVMTIVDEASALPDTLWDDYAKKLAETPPSEFALMGTKLVEPLPLPLPAVHSDFSFTARAFAKEKMNTKEWMEIDDKFRAMMRDRMKKAWGDLLPPQPPGPGTTPAQLVAVLVEREAPEGFMPSMLKEGEAMERRLHNGKAKWFIVPSLKQDDDCPAPTIIGG